MPIAIRVMTTRAPTATRDHKTGASTSDDIADVPSVARTPESQQHQTGRPSPNALQQHTQNWGQEENTVTARLSYSVAS